MDNTLFGDKVYSNILLGYFSTYHQERIEELGIELTEKDKENKYIKKNN